MSQSIKNRIFNFKLGKGTLTFIFTVITTGLFGCGNTASISNNSMLKNSDGKSPSRGANTAEIISLFQSDGMTIGLKHYYVSRGFIPSGSPQVTTYSPAPRDCEGNICYSNYSITQNLSNQNGETRTIKEIARMGDLGFNQIMDSYNGRGMFPEKFLGVGDEGAISMGDKGLASFVNFAGDAVDADMGFPRIGSVTEAFKYFFGQQLTCTNEGTAASCNIIFVKNGLPYSYNPAQSKTIVSILREAALKPEVVGSKETFRAEFIDCGDYQPASYPKDGCWIIGKK